MNNTPTDFFALLGLPRSFDLDEAALQGNYREQQSRWHPDRFVAASASERLVAVRQTSLLNDAYDTLKSPLRRIQHLLELQGVATAVHAQHELDEAFLFQQMEWREALQECELARDEEGLARLLADVRAALGTEQQACVANLEQGNTAAAKKLFHRLQFLYKLTEEIRVLEDKLLDY